MSRLATLALIAALLAACAALPAPAPVPTPAASTSVEPVTITFGTYNYTRPLYERLAEQFHAANPDVRVQLVSLDAVAENSGADESQERRRAAAADTFVADEAELRRASERFNRSQGEVAVTVELDTRSTSLAELTVGADCVAASGPPTPEDAPALLDLQPFLDLVGSESALLPPALLAPFQREGQLLGLPLGVTLPTLGYQSERFAAAGLEAPGAAWTPADVLAAAQQLTDAGAQLYGYASASGDLSADVRFWLGRAGARLGTVEDGQIAATLTDSRTVEATQLILALLRETSPHTRLTGYSQATQESDASGQTAIAQGRVGLWANPFSSGVEASGRAAPAPLGASGWSADDLGVSGLATKLVTRHADACWAWMQAVQADWGLLSSWATRPLRFPAHPAARAAAVASADPDVAALVEAYGASLDSVAAPLPAVIPEGLEPYWYYRAVDRALQGGDLERELADAQFLTEQFLACVQGGERPGVCARQVDPSYDGWLTEE